MCLLNPGVRVTDPATGLLAAAGQRFRIGRPDGKIKASLVSTFRLGLITTALTVSVLRFDIGTPPSPLLVLRLGVVTTALPVEDLRLGFVKAARMFRGFGLRAIVESPCAALAMRGPLKFMPMQASLQALGREIGQGEEVAAGLSRLESGGDLADFFRRALTGQRHSRHQVLAHLEPPNPHRLVADLADEVMRCRGLLRRHRRSACRLAPGFRGPGPYDRRRPH